MSHCVTHKLSSNMREDARREIHRKDGQSANIEIVAGGADYDANHWYIVTQFEFDQRL